MCLEGQFLKRVALVNNKTTLNQIAQYASTNWKTKCHVRIEQIYLCTVAAILFILF